MRNLSLLRWNVSSLQKDLFFPALLFLYFFTLSGDLLHIEVGIFRLKVNHFIALFSVFYFSLTRKWCFEKVVFFSCLTLLLSFFLSAFQSVHWLRSFTYAGILFFNLVAYFWFSFSLMMSRSNESYLQIYFWSFKCLGIYGVLQFLLYLFGIKDFCVTQTVADHFARAQGFSYEPSYYALYMTPFVFFYNAKVLLEGAMWNAKNLSKIIGVNLLLLVSTSTGGFFSYFCFWLVMFFCGFFPSIKKNAPQMVRRLNQWGLSFCLLFVSVFLLAPKLFLDSFFKFFMGGFFAHGSFRVRWNGLVEAWNLFLEHPWFGVGVGGVGPYFFQQTYLDGVGDVSGESLQNLEMFDPMNAFTELLASLGIFGLLCFGLFSYFYLRRFFLVLRGDRYSLEEKKMVFSFLISIIVMVISSQFNQGLLRTYIWAHLGISLGYVEQIIFRKREMLYFK